MIEEIIKKYSDFYNGKPYTTIADKILEEESVALSHRTLRRMISEYVNSNNSECCGDTPICQNCPKVEEVKNTVYDNVVTQSKGLVWTKENTVDYFKNQSEDKKLACFCGCGMQPCLESSWDTRVIYSKPVLQPYLGGNPENVLVISDLHGIYLDKKCFNVFLKVLSENQPDELVINGDALDLPFLSRHSQRLIRAGVLTDYSEIGEIELVKNKILKPLRAAAPKSNIVFRLGNHDERITNPYDLTQAQLKRLAIVYHHYQTTKLDEMLNLKELSIEYDAKPVRNYYGIYDIMHGLSLSKNAQEVNIMNRMSSGTTGHSHRLGVKYITKGNKHYSWAESGHMRTQDEVEYLPTAVLPDWQQGFISVKFSEDRTSYFQTPHAIINGECVFNGKLYNGTI